MNRGVISGWKQTWPTDQDAGGFKLKNPIVLPGDGTALIPPYSFVNDATSGLFRLSVSSLSAIGVSLAGVEAARFFYTVVTSVNRPTMSIGRINMTGISATFTGNTGWNTILINGTDIFDTSSVTTATWKGLGCSTIIRINNSATLASVMGLDFSPSLQNTAGTGVATTFICVNAAPIAVVGGGTSLTTTDFYGYRFQPSIADTATITNVYGIHFQNIGGTLAGLVTTMKAVSIPDEWDPTGTAGSVWGLAVGAVNSYHGGKITLGAQAAAATWDLHLQRGNSATNAIGILRSTTDPTSPASNDAATISVYKGATKTYLLIKFNAGGTVRYKSLDLTTNTVTWVDGTAAPA